MRRSAITLLLVRATMHDEITVSRSMPFFQPSIFYGLQDYVHPPSFRLLSFLSCRLNQLSITLATLNPPYCIAQYQYEAWHTLSSGICRLSSSWVLRSYAIPYISNSAAGLRVFGLTRISSKCLLVFSQPPPRFFIFFNSLRFYSCLSLCEAFLLDFLPASAPRLQFYTS